MNFNFKDGFDISNFSVTLNSKKHFLAEKLKISNHHQLGSDFCQLRRNSPLYVELGQKCCISNKKTIIRFKYSFSVPNLILALLSLRCFECLDGKFKLSNF
jgi:hypothetical protein